MFRHYINFVSGVMRDEAGDANAGGGDKGADKGAFDPDAFKASFKTEILGEFDKKLNGLSKGHKKDFEKFTTDFMTKFGSGNGGGNEGDKGGNGGGNEGDKGGDKGNPELNAMRAKHDREINEIREQLKKEQERSEAAEKSKRESARLSELRSTLSGIEFVDDKSRTAAFKMMISDVIYDDDENIVFQAEKGPLPLKSEAIKEWLEAEVPKFLAPRGSGGAGAKGGKRTGGVYVPSLDDDYSKLPPENQRIYDAKVKSVLEDWQTGKSS